MDALGVDLVNTGKFQFQCKNTKDKLNYPALLEKMPDTGINVLIHKYTQKSTKNFVEKGRYAILNLEDFLTILKFAVDNGFENEVK